MPTLRCEFSSTCDHKACTHMGEHSRNEMCGTSECIWHNGTRRPYDTDYVRCRCLQVHEVNLEEEL